jgi:hypothetical protein
MRRRISYLLVCSAGFVGFFLSAATLAAGSPDSYRITPDSVTMLIGDQRSFRMVDQNGHAQLNVTWTISNADAFQSVQGDELHLTARLAGEYRITARSDYATAEAIVTVVEGSSLPPNTVKWSSGAVAGCRVVKVIPARPTPNGPYVFEQSVCEDGEFVAAYTADGVQLWRTKLHGSDAPPSTPGGNDYAVLGNRLNAHAASICDSVSAGIEQQKVHDLLAQRNLPFHEEPSSGRVWLVEETNAQCRLWFDEKMLLVRKKKVFIAE